MNSNKLELLLIDDDEMYIYIHQRSLVKQGVKLKPTCFYNATETLAYIKENLNENTTYLLLLDINMPLMNGWQLMDILETLPLKTNILVVLVTSSIDEADKLKAKNYQQVIAFFIKPFNIQKVEELAALKELEPFKNQLF